MIRKHKRYSRPRKAFDKIRIDDENKLVARYGLKSKREIWKAEARISDARRQAKSLITAGKDEQDKLINKLSKLGLKVSEIADVLALNKEDWLKRRLQSIVVEKKLARTGRSARQLIAHKHIAINNKIVNIPSYVVPVDEEDKITVVKLRTREMKAENKSGGENGGK